MKTSRTKTIQGKKLSKNNSDAIMKITGDSNEVWEIESIKLKRKDAEGVGMKQPTNKDVMSLIKDITITIKDISNKLEKFIDYQMDFNKRIEAKVDKLYTLPTIKKELA